MKFTAHIHPVLLSALESKEECENRLEELLKTTFWATTHPINRETNIKVTQVSIAQVEVCLDLNQRDAEIVKDMIHEALHRYFKPEYDTDIDVEINTELELAT